MFFRFVVLVFLVLQTFPWLFAQGKVQGHHERLKKIRNEINRVQKELEANKKKETSVVDQLSDLDLDIDLTQSVIQNLKKEQRKTNRQIKKLESSLTDTKKELEILKSVFSKRLVYTYKYGRIKDLELLMMARSINDGLLWLEYQKRLAEHDYRNYKQIKDKQAQVARDKDLLTIEVQEKKSLLTDKITEDKKLKGTKRKREKLLGSVRQDMNLLKQRLAEREKAASEIQRLIVRLEQAPKSAPLPKPTTLFADLRGRMAWPAQGKIVAKFGRYRHPQLQTVTENIGIDIQAPQGSPVQVVARGTVTAIEWQRGLGNIVIVRHYGGYYSVYAHLEEILVNHQDEVHMGQRIGKVGESGSLKGPILHFEIWKGAEKLNPEKWLGKST